MIPPNPAASAADVRGEANPITAFGRLLISDPSPTCWTVLAAAAWLTAAA
ncbi:Uncharacterised protein [Mycobacterium tuberculosis]|uniref:Uncharacterized protein n=1 Tax=Mycobacterium tuberculosis TaxID=1773 RepID=A0A654TTQ0_MYCTX|nr:Uncharacterised protein [Mycobacterium tuberculosis]CFE78088.1 Uncharacterised protein [Mycobacterium tuberculosis]CFR97014.1 Uncharacterised protein [Mycobacterium tuberculosis]CFS20003.1 Uncharacterised protein [Mycobacterium tuberculosis]CKR49029.1 Uncharacterised protein [Mycobacterium tuberculosis]